MESVESELLKNLENLFGFQFGKGKKFRDLDTRDFLDVYKIFFRIYDSAWLLSDGKPKTSVLKQIQSFLQRMELGHLILKGEDLLDPKKNCRLLGAIISKLESRHNGTNNIQAAVRKIRLLKPKTATEKNHLRKPNSSGSSGEEEPVNPELIIPHKGKELPRTPPTKLGPETDVNKPDFLKPTAAPSPLPVHPKTYTTSAKIVSTQKGFRPILPTKEIPRTPMKGVEVTTPVDGLLAGHNLTVDFSSARLTSSNTSTPYDSRTSRNKNSSSDGDATFVIPTKPHAMANPDQRPDGELSESEEEDVFVDANAMADTYVKEPNVKNQIKAPSGGFDNTWVLEMENPDTKSENASQPAVAPEPQSTANASKKKPGKAPANTKAKDKPNSAAAKTKDDEDVAVKKATETMPENGVTNRAATDTLTVVPKSKKGKKPAKMESNNHDTETVTDAIAEPLESEPVPPIETKGKKGRGKKAVGKKEAIEDIAANADPPVSPEAPVAETEAKKGRAKRPSKKETNQDEVLETKADPPPAVVEPEEPVAEVKGKRGRGKKAVAKKEVAEDNHVESVAEPLPQETEVMEAKKGRGKRPSKKETSEENHVEEVVEKELATEHETVPPVAESKEKKGRGKKAQPASKPEENVSITEEKSEPVVTSPVVEANDEPAAKPGPKPKMGPKSKTGPKSKVEPKPAVEEAENPEPEIQEKKGRGKKMTSADSTPQTAAKDPPPAEAVPVGETNEISPVVEVRRGRARGKATAEEVNEAERKQSASPVKAESDLKEKRGRGRAAAKDGTDKAVKTDEEALPSVEPEPPIAAVTDVKEKRGRGRQAKTEATPAVEEMKDTAKSPEAVPIKKARGKKGVPVAKESVEAEHEVEVGEDTKAKGKKAVAKKSVEEEEEEIVPETAEKIQKATTKRGKAASVPEDAEPSPTKKLKEDAVELEGPRKSSRKKAETVKSYDESSERSGPISPKKRGAKKKPNIDEVEEADDQKKKPAKKKGTSDTPEIEPPKFGASKRTNKRGQAEEAIPSPTSDEKKRGGAKKAIKSPELPLKVVNGLETDTAASPAKRGKLSEDNEASEEPEKKTGRNRKKKDVPLPVETENESPVIGPKRGQRGAKEEEEEVSLASVDVEKKKPASRKKLAVAPEEETDSSAVQPKRGKRVRAPSTDPSPAGPPLSKSRRLKLVEQPTSVTTASDDEMPAPAVTTKRTYTRRNK
ncbi:titin-like isoform X2 [Daphnia carinata]|uniref:titin-like isoform X2 n=1 Tax=Daphnia carinata TaxID=120202 RepID=UPI00257A4852|nr:titin-like isoform X2 [Daphnia carinata]